jgi:trk system potassium uptake protein TrkH
MINFKIIGRFLGFVTMIIGVFLLFPALVSWCYDDTDYTSFLLSSGICLGLGSFLSFFIKPDLSKIRKREGYLIVALSWISMCLIGALPYIIYHPEMTIVNSIFESSSGFTTTGASIFDDIESLPHGLLFWRSLTQWIGGMGIIVFTVAIFPLLGIGGVELFVAESPGPQSDKIHPRIKEVAKRLWLIYVGLTLTLFGILFFVSGMDFFDSMNHAMTTMSTGGFSTKNDSIAHFTSPWVQYPILIFMLIGGMNYTVIYYLFKRRFKRAWRSDEFKTYLGLVAVFIFMVMAMLAFQVNGSIEQAFRESAFQVISVITTTGFVTADYTSWGNGPTFIMFVLLFLGACAGSTSGGIKIIRHLVFFKTGLLEFKRLLHPRAYIRLKIDGGVVPGRISTHILVFLLFYLILFVAGSIILALIVDPTNKPFLTSIGSVATCLGNVGPAIGSVGPVNNFSHIPDAGKLFLSFLMVIGRLEVFTILIILTPYFWKTN